MRFALLIWEVMGSAGYAPSESHREALEAYLSAMQAEGLAPNLMWLSIAPTAQWTGGEPYDAVVKGRGPTPPSFEPIDVYRSAELSGVLTVDCDDEEGALLWASRFPFIVGVEVRRITDGDDSKALMSHAAMEVVARGYWADPVGIASDRVDDIIWNRHDLVPSLLKALTDTAPEGELHRIGVGPLESLSIHARSAGADPTLDLLIAANIEPGKLMDILSGPWPEYLERWDVGERLKGILSPEQLAELATRSRRGGR